VSTVLSWLGFGPPRTTGALRGGDSPALNIWIIRRDGTERPAKPVRVGAFRSPIFAHDPTHVYAIQNSNIVDINTRDDAPPKEMGWPRPQDPPRLILGRGPASTAAIAVMTAGAIVLTVTPSTGASSTLASGLSPDDTATLTRQLGFCGGWVVYEGEQKGPGLTTRTDVFIRKDGQKLGMVLTSAWPGSAHGQPSFSADCEKIVFVSDDK